MVPLVVECIVVAGRRPPSCQNVVENMIGASRQTLKEQK